ncbi:MAG: alpha-glucan family phosphorylase [Planctomycetia bacterium]|nr:alpha-glucan family phosphorylase [Planctomycetia bacterium]
MSNDLNPQEKLLPTPVDEKLISGPARPNSSAIKLYNKAMTLANNLWWSWHPEVVNMFQTLDPVRWRQLAHNPIALLKEYTPERFEKRVLELVFNTKFDQAYRRLMEYISDRPLWAKQNAGVLGAHPVAYFSLEFGLHESVPIYSGGLGILAGDHIKSASGLGVPIVAVGLFYDQGYFKQRLNARGEQEEEYIETKVEYVPLETAMDKDGNKITVSVDTAKGPIYARVRKMKVGRVELYLLDTDIEENSPEDRKLTGTLYGGDRRTRIRQEIVCGIGGVKALRALGITPGVYHLNEGHNSFATLEVIRGKMEDDGKSFETALREVAQQTVFTTHTPVEAGHDYFDADLIEEHLGPLRMKLGLSRDQFMELGRKNPLDQNEKFCMTILGLKLSRYANAVSSLHGKVTRHMWRDLWPQKEEEEIPIGHITNGVHVPTWMAWQMQVLFERHIPGWTEESINPDVWAQVYKIDPGELWETHDVLKTLLIDFARRRIMRQLRRNKFSEEEIDQVKNILDPQTLTIGFARRFATYKRATLIMQDLEWLSRIVNDTKRPVQFVFAGKAHPADIPGKRFIQQIMEICHEERFTNRIVFLEDYDINVARHMVQGVDVWLNNPRRPLEASGTSGQKAVLNGVLNLSILDGWWAEAYDGTNGFAIGNGNNHVYDAITDERDRISLMEVLENEVIPMYYDVDEHGLPQRWIRFMMNSIATLAWRFSAHRMVADYARHAYLPAAGGLSAKMP